MKSSYDHTHDHSHDTLDHSFDSRFRHISLAHHTFEHIPQNHAQNTLSNALRGLKTTSRLKPSIKPRLTAHIKHHSLMKRSRSLLNATSDSNLQNNPPNGSHTYLCCRTTPISAIHFVHTPTYARSAINSPLFSYHRGSPLFSVYLHRCAPPQTAIMLCIHQNER